MELIVLLVYHRVQILNECIIFVLLYTLSISQKKVTTTVSSSSGSVSLFLQVLASHVLRPDS